MSRALALLQRMLPSVLRAKASTFGSPAFYAELAGALGGGATKSGKSVTPQTALEVATVLACARVIAEGVAQVPLKLFQQVEGARTLAVDHPLYPLLHRRPNAWGTSFELRETLVLHAVLTGDAFAFVNRARGRVAELVPIEPGRVTVVRAQDLTLTYRVRSDSGEQREFPAATIWHLRGPSWNNYSGLPIVSLAREAIGLAMATEETQARLHQRGMRPSGTYSLEGTLSPQQYTDLAKWLQDNYGGAANSGAPLILDRNAKWLPQSASGVDAQHLETRAHQVREICAAMRVLPIMIGYSDKAATFASAEQMFLAHVVHTLAPWYERIEQSIDCSLLTDQERAAGYYAKHVVQGLLRGAMKDTAEYLHKLVLDGVMTRNEARAVLDLNPLSGLDSPLTPSNMNVGATTAPADA